MSSGGTSALQAAIEWNKAGHAVCMAAVVSCWGSAPRPAGSWLAVREDGLFAGSVSGGCIEGDVITRAADVLASGKPAIEEYGVADAKAWEVGLACGGRISIWLAPLAGNLLSALQALTDKKQVRILACNMASGGARLIDANAAEQDSITRAAQQAAQQGHSFAGEIDGVKWFFRPFFPPLRLVVAGAVHIAEPLAAMAALAGYEVLVSDPRAAFANAARFAENENIRLSNGWPDKDLAAFVPDSRTAFTALTHDPKIDDPALAAALASPCFYVGALGSKKTHAARVERLQAQGVAAEDIKRIHAPIGLPLGGRAPAEIALAILAQMTSALHQK